MTDANSSYHLLDERIRRFIYEQRWTALRDVQEQAIPLILKSDQDVILAASTASGKTEAAFFPALTLLLQKQPAGLIVYISPLKALINDQFGRLETLCETLGIPVWPWHGDISASKKARFIVQRQGVLLITPESLEAFLCLKGSSVASVFARTAFFVIDELHAFIGSERGKQLQSLMHRIEQALKRPVRRIGLSATLGDMQLAAQFLRPGQAASVALVKAASSGTQVRIQLRGYEEPLTAEANSLSAMEDEKQEKQEKQEKEPVCPGQVAEHLFAALRGANNLVFPNSRREVERYTHLLNMLCEANQVRKQFWPHHGSLSKEIREDTESALKEQQYPATAICTTTLELGIDIGAVKCVAQIGPPPSVASLRQRLGRSGRREGEQAILRAYCIEDELSRDAPLAILLRLRTVQTAAMILLVLEGWCEPPRVRGMHLSTLVQQILSVIAQHSGATALEIFQQICTPTGPFAAVTVEDYRKLLIQMGKDELLMQDSSGTLLHGSKGEKKVNHYSFYAAFVADREFRIVAGGKALGSLPVAQMMSAGQRLLFAGRTWQVESVDEPKMTIYVTAAPSGAPPMFTGGAGRTHTRVRQRMRQLLESDEVPKFLDPTAGRFLAEARDGYQRLALSGKIVKEEGGEVLLLTWLGDAANEAVACLLMSRGFSAAASGLGVEVRKGRRTTADILQALVGIAKPPVPPLEELLKNAQNLRREKWDWALPDALPRKAYASQCLDLQEALEWMGELTAGVGNIGTSPELGMPVT